MPSLDDGTSPALEPESSARLLVCPKLVLVNRERGTVLLCRRRGERDLNDMWSLVGGKMKPNDHDIVSALKREVSEEVGTAARYELASQASIDLLHHHWTGHRMVLPHFLAWWVGGTIALNTDEYSDKCWQPIAKLSDLADVVSTVPAVVDRLLSLHVSR
jgi:8-oxo-dGTP pyrophosphatase MutT (NUDIX family)